MGRELKSLKEDLRSEMNSTIVENVEKPIKTPQMRLSTSSSTSGDGGLLTDAEMEQLQGIAEEIAKTVEEPKQIEAPSPNEIEK